MFIKIACKQLPCRGQANDGYSPGLCQGRQGGAWHRAPRKGTGAYPEPVITPCMTSMRGLAFPFRSSFTSSALCLWASMVAVLGYEWCCSRMCVLEAQGSLRQATFLSEWGILYSYFSFAPLKISAGWWVAPEGLHWIKIGQQGSWEQLFVTTMCWKWPVAWTDYTQWSLSGQQTYARDFTWQHC